MRQAEGRAAAAAEAREAAERGRQESERQRRQAEVQASTAASLMQAERQQRAEAQGLRYADLVLLSCAVLCCAVLCCALNLPAVRPAALTVLDCANPPTAYHTNTFTYLAACLQRAPEAGG